MFRFQNNLSQTTRSSNRISWYNSGMYRTHRINIDFTYQTAWYILIVEF